MTASQLTPEQQAELDKALYDAVNPLASAIRSRETGLSVDGAPYATAEEAAAHAGAFLKEHALGIGDQS